MTRLLLTLLLTVPLTVHAACPPEQRSKAVLARFQRLHPCPSTGSKTGPCPGWVMDHTIPLCLGPEAGGLDDPANITWMTRKASYVKDLQERAACRAKWGHQP